MPIDGIMTKALSNEFNSILQEAKVEKITQPEKDELVLHFHAPHSDVGKNVRLLLSANPSKPRALLISAQKENPIVAPNFCMLLRKHLGGARLIKVYKPNYERVLIFKFECRTDLYETVEKYLILEMMSKWSNLILIDKNGKIFDALRPVDFSVSEKRQLLVGLKYELPPTQDKTCLEHENILDFEETKKLDKALLGKFTGFSPLISREIAYKCTGQTDPAVYNKDMLKTLLAELYTNIEQDNYKFCVFYVEDKPLDFYCFDIFQYENSVTKVFYKSASEAIEAFYEKRLKQEHIKRGSADISKLISTLISRVSRKIDAQFIEMNDCKKAIKYRLCADIITDNIYKIKKGQESVTLTNYYENPPSEKIIELDKRLTPSQNAQKYYKLYKKSQAAEKYLQKQIPLGFEELKYLESVSQSLEDAQNLGDIEQIRSELLSEGYLKSKLKSPKLQNKSKPTEFISSDGFTIFAGKNNTQNDFLTLKIAEKHDIWFHVKDYPGSHVIVISERKTIPDRTLTQAAVIAATCSKIKDGSNVEVDYTEVKYIKKPSGSKPGMVIYEVHKTAFVTPSKKLINELIVKL